MRSLNDGFGGKFTSSKWAPMAHCPHEAGLDITGLVAKSQDWFGAHKAYA